IVLHHVAYGTVSPYEAVTAGDYSVAMRSAGAAASSQPVLSTSVTVKAGHAYTVAGMGPESGLRLRVINDQLNTPSGKSEVRVIQASLKQQTVKFTCGGQAIVPKATFASVSSYQAIPANTWTMQAIGSGSTATARFKMGAGTVHTMVVLDGASGLEIVNLEDAAGAGQPPVAAGVAALPAPTGPIVAPPQSAAAQVARPVSLTIPLIGVKTNLITLGLAAGGAMQVPSTSTVAGWFTGSPRPGAVGSSIIV